jgi:hypothetical protein
VFQREGLRAISLRVLRLVRRHGPIVALLIVVANVAAGVHHPGHSWGDDFALYLRQAQGLVDGNLHQVIQDSQFSVTASGSPGFSPAIYPWGFPLMLAPFVWRWGLDYTKLKLVMVGIFVAYLWTYHRVLLRRTHAVVAFGIVACVGTTLVYLQHTDYLLSELPYMLASVVAIWTLDRARLGARLHQATTRQLVVLGLAALYVFNTRREGLAILPAIAVAQVIDLRGFWRHADWRQLGKRLSIPWVTFAGGMVAMQVVLPNALRQSYDQSGLSQTWKKLTGPWHRDFATELGWNTLRGTALLVVFIVVMLGVVIACVRAPGLNLPVAVFAVLSMIIVGSITSVSPRYLMSITPFAVYFGAQAFAMLPLPRRAGVWVATVVLGVFVLHHTSVLPKAVRATEATNRQMAVAEGPESAWVLPVWDAVKLHTHRSDVVGFWRSRLMTLYTDRPSIQTYRADVMDQAADFYVMRKQWTFFQPLVSDTVAAEMGWVKVWEDEHWVLWQVRQPKT